MMSHGSLSTIDPVLLPHAAAMADCLSTLAENPREMHETLDTILAQTRAAIGADPALSAQWREQFLPAFLQAPFVERAFRKPLGYAGDFEMMNLIYRNMPEGETPLGRALHRWANSYRSAAAVRSRRRWILQQMQEHARLRKSDPYRILSLASGPATELSDLVYESFLADRADIRCIDQDVQSLAFARAGLLRAMAETGRQLPISFSSRSVKALLSQGGEREEGGERDFVYAMGLFDYLPDHVARPLVTLLHDLLAPGGRLVIGNYSRRADAQDFLDLVCDWRLLYRSLSEVYALASNLPEETRVDVKLDSTGCVWLLIVDKQ